MGNAIKAAVRWLTVLSLCMAIGLHWAALQSVAWAGMLLHYSCTGTLVTAVEKTFDGNHPCPICQAVEKGRQGEKKQEMQSISKIDMECRREPIRIIPPICDFSWPRVASSADRLIAELIVPPPREA